MSVLNTEYVTKVYTNYVDIYIYNIQHTYAYIYIWTDLKTDTHR